MLQYYNPSISASSILGPAQLQVPATSFGRPRLRRRPVGHLQDYDVGHLQNLGKKFRFKGYIPKIEDRSMTVAQLRRVLKYCQEACSHWYDLPKDEVDLTGNSSKGMPQTPLSMEVLNLYHIDSWLIWPATEASRSSFLELMADQAQPANWCVSHCWSQLRLGHGRREHCLRLATQAPGIPEDPRVRLGIPKMH
eukprot:g15559.t1